MTSCDVGVLETNVTWRSLVSTGSNETFCDVASNYQKWRNRWRDAWRKEPWFKLNGNMVHLNAWPPFPSPTSTINCLSHIASTMLLHACVDHKNEYPGHRKRQQSSNFVFGAAGKKIVRLSRAHELTRTTGRTTVIRHPPLCLIWDHLLQYVVHTYVIDSKVLYRYSLIDGPI